MKKTPVYTLLAVAGLASFAIAKWSRLPGTDSTPVNMSTPSNGAVLSSSNGIPQAQGFVIGDTLKPITLAAGKSEAVIKFTKQAVIKSASFVNDGIEGKVATSTSSDGKEWNSLSSAVFSPADRFVSMDTGAAQGRYLRLQFELIRGGSIRNFEAFGNDSGSDYTVTQPEDGSGSPINFAGGLGGGRLIYMSPEDYGRRNETASSSKLEFPESEEKYRTAVYDMGQVRTMDEFGSVHSARPVRLSVYTFDSLPEKEDWRGRLAFDPTIFDTTEPVATGEDAQGQGVVKIKPKKLIKSRYVALRWEPDFNPPGFTVGGAVISGKGKIKPNNENNNGNNNNNGGVGGEGQATPATLNIISPANSAAGIAAGITGKKPSKKP